MKRYLASYNRNTVTIRDRKTNKSIRLTHVADDIADLYINAVTDTNYVSNQRKNGKLYIKELDADTYISKKTCTKWGDIQPDKIKWATSWYNPDEKSKKKENILSKELDKLLEI